MKMRFSFVIVFCVGQYALRIIHMKFFIRTGSLLLHRCPQCPARHLSLRSPHHLPILLRCDHRCRLHPYLHHKLSGGVKGVKEIIWVELNCEKFKLTNSGKRLFSKNSSITFVFPTGDTYAHTFALLYYLHKLLTVIELANFL